MTNNGVRISFKEIYQLVLDTSKAVSRIETKLEDMEQTEEICRRAADQADEALCRVREMAEQQKWLTRAIVGAVISGLMGALIYFLLGAK